LKIRQSVIAHPFKENNGLRVVQEFAGQKCANITEAYIGSGFEGLKANIEKLPPRQ